MKIVVEALEALFDHRAPNLPPSGFAEIMDRLIWCLNDNGETVLELQRRWLAGNDPERAAVGLMMSEAAPFHSRDEAIVELNQLAEKWPHLRPACDSFLVRWSDSFGK